MTARKERLTVTVDPDVVAAGQRAVAGGEAESLSGWVNAALVERARRDEQLRALGAAVASYEAEFGEITAEEAATLARADRKRAVVVRGKPSAKPRRRRTGTA